MQPSTTACPLLPGQQVNVLEVPVLARSTDETWNSEPTSCLSSFQFTLNPKDKFLTPTPPSLSSQTSCLMKAPMWAAVGDNTQISSRPETAGGHTTSKAINTNPLSSFQSNSRRRFSGRRSEPSSKPAGVSQVTYHLRRSQSTGDCPRTSFAQTDCDFLDLAQTSLVKTRSLNHSRLLSQQSSNEPVHHEQHSQDANKIYPADFQSGTSMNDTMNYSTVAQEPTTELEYSRPASSLSSQSITKSFANLNFITQESTLPTDRDAYRLDPYSSDPYAGKSSWLSLDEGETRDFLLPEHDSDAYPNDAQYNSSNSENNGRRESYGLSEFFLEHTKSIASNRTSGIFSAISTTTTGQTGYMTPSYCSQPLTPTASEFGVLAISNHQIDLSVLEEADEHSTYHENGGFEGYSLPENEHASALTLRNLTNATSRSSLRNSSSPQEKSGTKFVERWIDGSENNKTALQELVDDLGYLGTMIA